MRLLSLAAGWGWAAAIVWLSLTPSPPQVDVAHSDKLGHCASYAVLMFWFARLYVSKWAHVGYAVAFAAMGVSLEFLQGHLGYRTFEILDMLANVLGVLLGWAAAIAVPVRKA
ncbi:MAG TPA: VanZ family protein [Burkholderiales bacterium]|jgi:VanZ family protein|nr:VanZ family protein [Burkholderiales bacterium]